MTTQSPDIFLEMVDVVVIFLKDGVITAFNMNTFGKIYESGDILNIDRNCGRIIPDIVGGCPERNCNGKRETSIVLGFGESSAAAVEEATKYFRRICQWDGCEDASEVELDIFSPGVGQIFTESMSQGSDVDVLN